MTVKFVKELPEVRRLGRPEAAWKAELRARPGEWAEIPIKAKGVGAYNHRTNEFEIVARAGVAYGRYVGAQ